MNISINYSKEEVIKAKFAKTLTVISSYWTEASNDKEVDIDYSASGVLSRIKNIKETFETDLHDFINEINLIENDLDKK